MLALNCYREYFRSIKRSTRMASITINASAGGGWYGSVTTTEHDTPDDCERACQLLETLLAARTVRARPPRKVDAETPTAPTVDSRAEILARLSKGPLDKKSLLTGLGKNGAESLKAMVREGPTGPIGVTDSGLYCAR